MYFHRKNYVRERCGGRQPVNLVSYLLVGSFSQGDNALQGDNSHDTNAVWEYGY